MPKVQPIDSARKYPAQERSKNTVEHILQATAHILLHEGERRLTTNHIARRAGFSIGTIYQYFPNKEAIVAALIEKQRGETIRRLRAVLEQNPEDSFEEKVGRIVRVLIETFARNRHAIVTFSTLIMRMMLTRTGPAQRYVPSDLLIEAWMKSGHSGARPLTESEAFVLTRAVIGVLRQAVLEDSPLLTEPSFATTLQRLITGFFEDTTRTSPIDPTPRTAWAQNPP